MTHEIVVREAQIFGGLVIPRVLPGFKTSGSDLVEFLKGRLRDRDRQAAEDIYTIYIPDPSGQNNALVCFAYDYHSEIPIGDVFARSPKGIYAIFRPIGEYSDPVEDVWAQVHGAADSGEINRAFAEEIEILHPDGGIELHISISL
ncbi:AraC family transcriptional regulator [Antrihabitans cavernicola]|uniref:AraC family transcriptional regulator n=1 Tax=Antrihabitans cavernicola TaxID=2495913 RepID=A0A5A7SGL9_9NOCA|nr:AraC family transcriptional regulator [Spelaeibacter cavernicola]KAA0023793.1 AraC family transcriptional regulator [Spelaeibacter cavernicola]